MVVRDRFNLFLLTLLFVQSLHYCILSLSLFTVLMFIYVLLEMHQNRIKLILTKKRNWFL